MNNGAKAHEKSIKELFVGQCWSYLRDNFHKFNQTNQIKIALELCKKDMPQEISGAFEHKVTELATIRKEIPGELGQPATNRIAEYFIGPPSSSTDS